MLNLRTQIKERAKRANAKALTPLSATPQAKRLRHRWLKPHHQLAVKLAQSVWLAGRNGL
jgi:hypothetical protein